MEQQQGHPVLKYSFSAVTEKLAAVVNLKVASLVKGRRHVLH